MRDTATTRGHHDAHRERPWIGVGGETRTGGGDVARRRKTIDDDGVVDRGGFHKRMKRPALQAKPKKDCTITY